jgi:serine/threonine protein kinase
VAEGLAYLHGVKVVHGDINGVCVSPFNLIPCFFDEAAQANILICDDRRAQIADFGLAIVGDATIGRMSTQRTYHGTTRWMSPERLLGLSRRLGSSDDVYAFGGLMYMVSRVIDAK